MRKAAEVVKARHGFLHAGPNLHILVVTLRCNEAVEAQSPELVALYAAGLEYQLAQLQQESTEPLWARAWRPAGMYLFGFLWLWNIVVLHVAKAIWKIALPQTPFETLIQISGLYMGLYMGGHTLKDVAAKWLGGGK